MIRQLFPCGWWPCLVAALFVIGGSMLLLGHYSWLDDHLYPYRSWLPLFRSVSAIVLALGVTGLGMTLVGRPPGEGPLRLALMAFLLGYAATAAAITWLAFLGVLHPVGWWLVIAAVAAGVPPGARLTRDAAAAAWALVRRHPVVAVLLAPAAILLGFRLFLLLAPTPAWDTLSYHFRLADVVAREGRLTFDHLVMQAEFPSGIQMGYALAMKVADSVVAQLYGAIAALALLGLVGSVAYRAGGSPGALFVLGSTPPILGWIGILGSGYTDWLMAGGVAGVLLAMQGGAAARDRARWLGILAGLYVLSSKQTSLIAIAGGLAVACLCGKEILAHRREALWAAALAAGIALPWYGRLYLRYGNPLWPFPIPGFPREEMSALDWEMYFEFYVASAAPGSIAGLLVPYLTLPWRVATGGEGVVSALTIALLAAALPIWCRGRLAVACFVGWWAGFAVWAMSSHQVRFLFTALPFLLVGGACQVGALWSRIMTANQAWQRLLAGVAVGGLLALEPIRDLRILAHASPPFYRDTVGHLTGEREARMAMRELLPAIVLADELRRPDGSPATVVMMFENRAFGASNRVITRGLMHEAAVLAGACGSAEAFDREIRRRWNPDFVIVDEAYHRVIAGSFPPDAPGLSPQRQERRRRYQEGVAIFDEWLVLRAPDSERLGSLILIRMTRADDPLAPARARE